jgi:hypothetical protein
MVVLAVVDRQTQEPVTGVELRFHATTRVPSKPGGGMRAEAMPRDGWYRGRRPTSGAFVVETRRIGYQRQVALVPRCGQVVDTLRIELDSPSTAWGPAPGTTPPALECGARRP